MKPNIYLSIVLILFGCSNPNQSNKNNTQVKASESTVKATALIILGNVQDAGSPHIACKKSCCKALFQHPDPLRKVTALGIIDPINKKTVLMEASTDMPVQLKDLNHCAPFPAKETPDAIFLTHAHIGHYTGLMYLGKEAMNADSVPVYAMPRMLSFLGKNGPWSQLVRLNNIQLYGMVFEAQIAIYKPTPIEITSNIKVTAFLVPHRDEYSETVGFYIEGANKKILFIPDIDKWEKWDNDIIEVLSKVDYAFIDGTFYDGSEIKTRDISEIPHPFIVESMAKFKDLPAKEKDKIYFIHLNHTNPALDPKSEATKTILKNGYHVARMHMIFPF